MKIYKSLPLVSLSLAFVCAVMFWLSATPVFELSDDIGILSQVKGLYGIDATYITSYMSLPLGLLLVNLYKINNSVQWYSILLYSLLFLSLFISVYLFVLYLKHMPCFPVFIGVSVFLHWKVGSFVSFTSVALISFFTAVGVLFFYLKTGVSSRFLIVMSSILLCLSYALRPSIVPVGVALSLPLVFFCAKQIYAKIWFILLICLPLFVAICVDFGMFSLIKSDGSIEHNYSEYNRARSRLLDTGFSDFDDNTKRAVSAAGWDLVEFNVINNWWLYDRNLLSISKINTFLEKDDRYKIQSLVSVDYGVDKIKEYSRVILCVFAIAFICLLTSYIKPPTRHGSLPAIFFVANLCILFALMCFRFPMRVAFPSFYSLVLCLPVYFNDTKDFCRSGYFVKSILLMLSIGVVLLMVEDGFSAIDNDLVVKRIAAQKSFSSAAKLVCDGNGKDTVFVNLGPHISNLVSSYRPFDENNQEYDLKLLPGGAFSNTKWYKDYINREFGGCDDNVVPCLIDNDKAVFYFYDTKYLKYDVFVKKIFTEYLNKNYNNHRRSGYIRANILSDNRFSLDNDKVGFIFFTFSTKSSDAN